ncbi:MAG: 30S ribosomal protein S4, partial [Chloroflexota bacterium]|nr:30S ribosomal protein S4 [Chloroflexota bacterium]
RKLDIPSAHIKEGDTISFTPRGQRSAYYQVVKETIKSKQVPSWLQLDTATLTGKVIAPPEVVPGQTHLFNENVIIEYYSR